MHGKLKRLSPTYLPHRLSPNGASHQVRMRPHSSRLINRGDKFANCNVKVVTLSQTVGKRHKTTSWTGLTSLNFLVWLTLKVYVNGPVGKAKSSAPKDKQTESICCLLMKPKALLSSCCLLSCEAFIRYHQRTLIPKRTLRAQLRTFLRNM
jgi:hypothetical protein